MIFQKPYNNKYDEKRGIISIDILIACMLATMSVILLTDLSMNARLLFNRSYNRAQVVSDFVRYNKTADGVHQIGSTTISITSRAYGELIEKKIVLSASNTPAVSFVRIDFPDAFHFSDTNAKPQCSVDYFAHHIVGSYPIHQNVHVRIRPVVLPIGQDTELTDIEVRNGIAYIAADPRVVSDPDLYIVDLGDQDTARLINNLDIGPGISAIALSQNRLYASVLSTTHQLDGIDLIRGNSSYIKYSIIPQLATSFRLSTPDASTTLPRATAVTVKDTIAYLGTEKWDGNELSSIDVSNRLSFSSLGGFDIGSKVNDLYVENSRLYVADADEQQLRVFDVEDPTQLQLHSTFAPTGWTRQTGKSINQFEQRIAFGRTTGGFNIVTDHELFLSSSTEPFVRSGGVSLDIPGGVYGIVQDRKRMYIITHETDKEFQIINLSSLGDTHTFSLPVKPAAITCDGSIVYILGQYGAILYEVTFE